MTIATYSCKIAESRVLWRRTCIYGLYGAMSQAWYSDKKTLLGQTTSTPISRETARIACIRRRFARIAPLVRNLSEQSCRSTLNEPKRANSPWQKRRSSHSQIPKERPHCHRVSRASRGLIVMSSRSSARKPLCNRASRLYVQASKREVRQKSVR